MASRRGVPPLPRQPGSGGRSDLGRNAKRTVRLVANCRPVVNHVPPTYLESTFAPVVLGARSRSSASSDLRPRMVFSMPKSKSSSLTISQE